MWMKLPLLASGQLWKQFAGHSRTPMLRLWAIRSATAVRHCCPSSELMAKSMASKRSSASGMLGGRLRVSGRRGGQFVEIPDCPFGLTSVGQPWCCLCDQLVSGDNLANPMHTDNANLYQRVFCVAPDRIWERLQTSEVLRSLTSFCVPGDIFRVLLAAETEILHHYEFPRGRLPVLMCCDIEEISGHHRVREYPASCSDDPFSMDRKAMLMRNLT